MCIFCLSHSSSILRTITCRLQYLVCPTVGVPPPEASTCTAVTMQGNPSYAVVEEGMTLEPNPCYTPMQANSVYI